MEFWPENQGQTPLYSKFGTVPGRNCSHNYHDRHQVPHYPLYYSEQQDQGRESSYWTVPGSRTGGAPQEYTNWTDHELTTPSSTHFPFILDRHAQQHQDLGDYQLHEARDREWTAAQRAAREYERGLLREGWQRRWEPCGPVRYNREVSAKRSDSSYRELEAWAARYSHSLPRRRRIEAELRGASQGLLESSRAPERDSRSGTDPRVAALQQVRQSASIRESGLWDRGGRQQAPTYYPSQTPATDTSHMLDIKEKTGYQRRVFSTPPGYIAPPPYDSPHKGSPILQHCDTSWEQEGKRQAHWSQPALRKQDASVALKDHRKEEKEEFTKPDVNQKIFTELEGLKQRRQETDALLSSSPLSIQDTHIQHESMLSLQQPQVLQAVENKKINEEPLSKVIEGRKFRLNKKAGGMTIFCLVSRIAGTTESPSLPICMSQTNIQNKELGGVSQGLKDSSSINQAHKLADEVDFRAPPLTEQSNTADARNVKAKQEETPTCVESEMLEDNLSNKADVVSPEKANTNDADSTFGRQVAQSVQPVSVKYPLWREPSITSRVEAESSATCLKANSKEGESDVLDPGKVHPIDVEVRRLDIKTDTESEDSKGLLVIDTTCVVVKMELIPSPKKEHVHYLHTEHSPLDIQSTDSPEFVQSNSQINQDVAPDQNTEANPFHVEEMPETELDSDLTEEKAPEEESEISSLCMSPSPVSERETLEERAERILGIPLHDCVTKQQPEDATSLTDSCVEDQELELSQIKDNDIDGADEQIPEDTREEGATQNQFEAGQTDECLQENDDARDQEADGDNGDFAGFQDRASEEHYTQLQIDVKPSLEIETTEDPQLNLASEEWTTEQEENDISSHHPTQCHSPITNLSNPSLLLPDPDCEEPNPALSLMLSSSDLTPVMQIPESNIEESPDPELIALSCTENLASHPETSSLPHTPSPPPLEFTDSTLITDDSPSPSPLGLIDQTAETVSDIEETQTTEDPQLNLASEEWTTEQEENDISSHHPSQCHSPITNLSNPSLLLPDPDCEEPNPALSLMLSSSDLTPVMQIPESNIEESPDPELIALSCTENLASHPETSSLPHTPSPPPLEFTDSTLITDDSPSPSPLGLIDQTAETVSDIEDQDEEVETSQPIDIEISDPLEELAKDMTEELVSEQQYESGQPDDDDDACVKENNVTDEQQTKEADKDPTDHITEQTHKTVQENAIEVDILQQQLECVQAEDVACVLKSFMTEEQLLKEVSEDPTCQENVTDIQTQTEVNILQQQSDNGQEEEICLKESSVTEEQSQTEADAGPTGLVEQTPSIENATDSQTQIETALLQDIEPQTEPSDSSSFLPLVYEVSQSPFDVISPSELPSPPHKSNEPDAEFVPLFGKVCPSVLNPDSAPAAGISEAVSPPLHVDSCESLQFSSSSCTDLPPVLPSSSSTPLLQEGSGRIDPDSPLNEEPQYPKSLWDAVNRIRKHTAPDSENEEEEVSEMWDPESVGEDLGCPDVVVGMNSERIVPDGAGQQEVSAEGSVEDVEVGQIQQDLCHEEPSGHAEEDTLSCSSTSSHSSGDTVIVADEDEVEETAHDAGTESKTGNEGEFQTAEREQCCSAEVKAETAAKEDGDNDGDESTTNESSQGEEVPAEAANITVEDVEMM